MTQAVAKPSRLSKLLEEVSEHPWSFIEHVGNGIYDVAIGGEKRQLLDEPGTGFSLTDEAVLTKAALEAVMGGGVFDLTLWGEPGGMNAHLGRPDMRQETMANKATTYSPGLAKYRTPAEALLALWLNLQDAR